MYSFVFFYQFCCTTLKMTTFPLVKETYVCPKDFEEETVESQLYYEDLKTDCDLWLIRAPSDLELSEVENQVVILDDNSGIQISLTDKGEAVEYLVDNQELAHLSLILPKRNEKKLTKVRKIFKGSVIISRSTDNNLSSVNTEISQSEVDSTGQLKKRKKKSPNEEVQGIENSVNSSFETEIMHDISEMPKYSKKESSKRHKKASGIKLEMRNSNLDDFPNCVSQK